MKREKPEPHPTATEGGPVTLLEVAFAVVTVVLFVFIITTGLAGHAS